MDSCVNKFIYLFILYIIFHHFGVYCKFDATIGKFVRMLEQKIIVTLSFGSIINPIKWKINELIVYNDYNSDKTYND